MSPKKSFLLRLDPGLYKELETWAERDFRSVNAQIEYILTRAAGHWKSSERKDPEGEIQREQPDWEGSGTLDISMD